jgi:hypothetical protein
MHSLGQPESSPPTRARCCGWNRPRSGQGKPTHHFVTRHEWCAVQGLTAHPMPRLVSFLCAVEGDGAEAWPFPRVAAGIRWRLGPPPVPMAENETSAAPRPWAGAVFPQAMQVARYRAWHSFGRQVRTGERGIAVIYRNADAEQTVTEVRASRQVLLGDLGHSVFACGDPEQRARDAVVPVRGQL